jgi:hypothetical protein
MHHPCAADVGPLEIAPMSTLRKYADDFGMLAFPDEDAVWMYEKACERYGADGDRAALMRELLRLAVAPKHIRWHLARPGRRMVCMY